MNATKYINVLDEHLLSYYEPHGCTGFMHDGAPCHRAKIVTQWLTEHHIATMEWPGNIPDLRPIENAWNHIKRQVCSRENMSLQQLKAAIKDH